MLKSTIVRTAIKARRDYIRSGDVVLFQGDSITDAFRKPDEINNAYQLGAGYAMIVSGKLLRQRPADHLQFINRGISGHTLGHLQARWQLDAIALQPSVISLLVGINDTSRQAEGNSSLSPPQFEKEYRELLQQTR